MQTLGPYRVLAELGRGGMGAVYRAQDSRTGEEVALKVLLDAAPNPNQLERFRREAEAAEHVQHPHLVRCLEHSLLPPRPYAVFEFVPGETLAQRVKRVGPLSWQEAAGVLKELAQGVSALHAERILHRDIKPDNVILAPGGAKLADFGLAKDLDRGPSQRRALALLALKRYVDAAQEAERGLGLHPGDRLLQNALERARDGLAEIAAAPPYAAAFARGMELRASGREATRELQVALRDLPRELPVVLGCAERLFEAHEPRVARAFLERHGPEFTQASAEGSLLWAKTALFLEGGLEESLRWVEQALSLDPALRRAHLWRRALLTLLSRRLQSQARDPNDAQARTQLRRVRAELEDYLRDLGVTLDQTPDDSPERQARVEILVELGRREEALADCERGLELDPTFSPLRRLRRELAADLAR